MITSRQSLLIKGVLGQSVQSAWAERGPTASWSTKFVAAAGHDALAAENSWISEYDPEYTNTATVQISRVLSGATPLVVRYSVGGTASNGLDYFQIPSSMVIPAYSDSASVLIVPTGNKLPTDSATINISLLSDPAYSLGNCTNTVVTLLQYQALPRPHIGFSIPVGTNLSSQVFSILSYDKYG